MLASAAGIDVALKQDSTGDIGDIGDIAFGG